MKNVVNQNKTLHKSIVNIFALVMLVLSIPLIAMYFTDEVNWDAHDFIFAATLLLGVGLSYAWIANKMHRTTHKVALGCVFAVVLVVVWVELAVGIFD